MLWILQYLLLGVLLICCAVILFSGFFARIAPRRCRVCHKQAKSYHFEKLGHCEKCDGLGQRLKYHHYLDPSTVAGSYGVNNYTCSTEKCNCVNLMFGEPICDGCYFERRAKLEELEIKARELTETGSQ